MIVTGIILGLLLFLILGLLFSPFTLVIDTERNVYQISMKGIGKVTLIPSWETDKMIILRWKLWFWEREYLPIEGLMKGEKKKTSAKKPHKRRRKRSLTWQKMLRLLRSFHVHHFQLDIDTRDPVWNAWLYPLTFFLNRERRQLSINFVQYNACRLKVSNRLAHLLSAWIF